MDPLVEHQRRLAFREWNQRRRDNIHANVTAADVLQLHGVNLQRGGLQSEQISCPFHGDDRHPSAKYFPGDGDRRSGVWCYVCHERWDALLLWKKFRGTERFSELLREIERAFGLTPPEAHGIPERPPEYDPLVDEVRQLFETAERRLREYRSSLPLPTVLKLGQLLDHTQYYLDKKQITLAVAKERLTAVQDRIKKLRKPSAATPADPQR